MSLQHILALTVLISFSTFEFALGECTQNVTLPTLNITAMSGHWFMVASPLDADLPLCTTNVIEQLSYDSFTMKIVSKDENGLHNLYDDITLFATLDHDCNLVNTRIGRKRGEYGPTMAVFDTDYNSYMAMYSTSRGESYPGAEGGLIVLWTRDKILSDDISAKIQNSSFYRSAKKIYSGLNRIGNGACDIPTIEKHV